jgi:hypothetical protein
MFFNTRFLIIIFYIQFLTTSFSSNFKFKIGHAKIVKYMAIYQFWLANFKCFDRFEI